MEAFRPISKPANSTNPNCKEVVYYETGVLCLLQLQVYNIRRVKMMPRERSCRWSSTESGIVEDQRWDGETWWETIWPETRWRQRWQRTEDTGMSWSAPAHYAVQRRIGEKVRRLLCFWESSLWSTPTMTIGPRTHCLKEHARLMRSQKKCPLCM